MPLTRINNSSTYVIFNSFKPTLLRLILFTFLLIWIFGFLQPTFLTQKNSIANYFLVRIYSRVCHQESSKCITIASEYMLVCARCTGIYLGALIAGLFTLVYKIPQLNIKFLGIALLPLLLDVCFISFRFYSYSKIVALATGLFFGGVVYVCLLTELENFFLNKSIKRNE